jgi:PAS domain S-box-containing protein
VDAGLATLADVWQFQLDADMTVVDVTAPDIMEASMCMIAPHAVGKNFLEAINVERDVWACAAFKRLYTANARIRNATFVRLGEQMMDATLLVNAEPVWSDDGNFWGYRCVVSNISATINATRETAYSEAILGTFVCNVPNLIVVKDVEGHYLTLNPFAERTYGISREVLVGRRAQDILPPHIAAECCRDDDMVLLTESVLSCEQKFAWPDGMHIFHTVKFPIFDVDRCIIGIGAMGADVTQKKKFQREPHQSPTKVGLTGLKGRVC